MRILSKSFTDKWNGRLLNVHPSLLPAFAGGMDAQVHEAVIAAGVKESGCTVHYVTHDVDGGTGQLWFVKKRMGGAQERRERERERYIERESHCVCR